MATRTTRLSMALTAALLTTTVVVAPNAGVSEAAYNAGVKAVHLNPALDECFEGQALPCAPGAAVGRSNVLRVTQSKVNGYHQFNGLAGNSTFDGSLWLAADFSAECKVAHKLVHAQVDANLGINHLDGPMSELPTTGTGVLGTWPHHINTPKAKSMPTTRLGIIMPIDEAFVWPTIDGFATKDWIYHVGESMIAQRMASGMSAAEARSMPHEIETTITVAVEAWCLFALGPQYFKRRYRELPLTIRYEPVQVGPAGSQLPEPSGSLSSAPEVTDVFLAVLPDPDDPCVLHLSGSIHTNQPMTVEYRFLNQFGQPSNTYSLDIDHFQQAFVHHTVAIPVLDGPDPAGDLVAVEGPGEIGGKVAVIDDSVHSGSYTLEVVSPHHKQDVTGFSVPFCPGHPPSGERTPAGQSGMGDLTGGARPTHDHTPLELATRG